MTATLPDLDGAICAQVAGDLWFPEDGKGSKPHRYAARICHECPVREACLAFALADPSLEGVWGGTTPRQREGMRARGVGA